MLYIACGLDGVFCLCVGGGGCVLFVACCRVLAFGGWCVCCVDCCVVFRVRYALLVVCCAMLVARCVLIVVDGCA